MSEPAGDLTVEFSGPISEGLLLRRYQRFLADVRLDDGNVVTAHCANPGSMLSCLEPGTRAWLTRSANPARKLEWTWQVARRGRTRIYVNPVGVNAVVAEALTLGRVKELRRYRKVQREVRWFPAQDGLRTDATVLGWGPTTRAWWGGVFVKDPGMTTLVGDGSGSGGRHAPSPGGGRMSSGASFAPGTRWGDHSRLDFLLSRGQRRCYVEVKSATLALGGGRTAFPDAVTTRGTKHLEELMRIRAAGHRAVLLFCASRNDTRSVEPADFIDPEYGATLRRAAAAGVELLAHKIRITQRGVTLWRRVPLLL